MSCCLFKFNNLLIQCLAFSSPGYLLPIKHIIQGVTLLCFGLPTFQAKAGERGTENFVGINQAVELWGQIPAWFPWDCLAWSFFGSGPVLVCNLVAGKKKWKGQGRSGQREKFSTRKIKRCGGAVWEEGEQWGI